ncbi:MAG TPA: MMPL family transporter, partial [Candidatus Sumerlaeota bacterium]|nr:MMPL family transporter [Candidatus Sumerlaeota bacterium]
GDIMSPSTVDNIEQAGPGTVRFEWLMKEPPATREEALAIRDNARDNPLLYGTLLSEDGRALAIYLPLTSKDLSYRVYTELKKKIAGFKGDEQYHITGLPVAEDTFGVEMFVQMGVSAPLAMLIIFILMFVFFRKIVLILSPLIIAMISVIWTMGLLIILGYPVHIMSSMIPIFIMPISVLDSVHIKSQFFDRYQSMKDQKKTLYLVMSDLFTPMLYTSLTTVAGFLSLALTPIPPVQVFGVFVAFGVAAAWILTITFVPAFTMLIRKSSLENFGMKPESEGENTMADRFLHTLGRFAYRFSPMILVLTAVAALISLYGISLIQVNDNPVKWFSRKHPIRIADKVLNEHFGGTYMGYLVLQSSQSPRERVVEAAAVLASLEKDVMDEYGDKGIALLKEAITILNSRQNIENLNDLKHVIVEDFSSRRQMAETSGDYDTADVWSLMETALVPIFDPFKNPKVLEHMALLQESLLKTNVVGKSNSVTDLVKKVHKELLEGKEEEFRIPDTAQAVGQCLLSFQNSHRPNDLWRLVTPDYETANIWVQLTSGDNKDMSRVVAAVDEYMKANPGPVQMKHEWFGLTYINVIWQEKMVKGMLESFLGSFLIVWLMMLILYRSVWWGTIAMIPMTVTVGVIYGFIGFIGKDYDMPVAVLSALTLGLAVDFGIHFLSRA